jgi:hypothetical protein
MSTLRRLMLAGSFPALACVAFLLPNRVLSREPVEGTKETRSKYSAWQYQPERQRYWCTYSYTNGARQPSFQYVLYYPDEGRRGVYYWQNRAGRVWACCIRPGAADYNRHATKWYRQDKQGKWVRRADGDSPQPPDGGRPIADHEDGTLPAPPPPREFEKLAESERQLAERFHKALAEIKIENGEIVELDLAGSELDEKLLAELRKAPALRRLYLDSTNLTDDGLKQVAAAAAVMHLDISQTQASDAGLKHVASMKSLRTLIIRGCHSITRSGVGELKKSLPKLLVTGPSEESVGTNEVIP